MGVGVGAGTAVDALSLRPLEELKVGQRPNWSQ